MRQSKMLSLIHICYTADDFRGTGNPGQKAAKGGTVGSFYGGYRNGGNCCRKAVSGRQ